MVNFKIYDVTIWLTNNWNNILTNISRSKGNQAMKFVQLIEYNMGNILLEESYTKCGGDVIPRHFSKESKNRAYLWIKSLKFYTVCLYCMPS